MKEYYFLFLIAGIVSVLAVVQDMKKREVANWLNFIFIAVALSYRGFYAFIFGNKDFFFYGALGFAFMFFMAYVLYYARAFAGGDAKLLMGFGVILPYNSYLDILILGIGFIFALFLCGLIWSLGYSIYLVFKEKEKFKKEFLKNWKINFNKVIIVSLVIFIILLIFFGKLIGIILGLFVFLSGILLIYVKSLDEVLLKEIKVGELREGDWIEREVKIGKKTIEKSVHGLSLKDIEFLKRYAKGKKIKIKEGIPFTPAFFGALIIMVFFLEVLLSYLSFLKIF